MLTPLTPIKWWFVNYLEEERVARNHNNVCGAAAAGAPLQRQLQIGNGTQPAR